MKSLWKKKRKKEVRYNLAGVIENVMMRGTREGVPKMDNKIRDVASS